MNLATQLENEEGRVRHAYQDHLGYWTIGVGHLIYTTEEQKWTKQL